MNLRVIPPLLLCAASVAARAQIAYVKRNSLYVLPCDSSGRPTGAAFRVCRLWRHYDGDGVEVGWTPDRKIVLVHHVDAWNGPRRFGLSQSAPVSGISIVEAKPNAPIVRLTEGQSPTFSPDGRTMVFSSGDLRGDLWRLDRKTNTKRIFRRQAVEPVLSRDGSLLACVRVGSAPDRPPSVEVLSFPSGRRIDSFAGGANPTDLQISPTGTILAVHDHLSRPLTGHTLYTLRRHPIELETSEPFAPAIIEDWSPDGRQMLTSWRIVDPANDGNWIQEYVGLTPLGSGKPHRLATGNGPVFSADGRHVLYLSADRSRAGSLPDLMRLPIRGRKATTLVKNVAGFALFRRTGGRPSTILFGDRPAI